ncbi:ABC transporter permease [Thermomonospora umbrina]|uniref:Xylose transport system permease protein XylH n=1 Tax=Thermomonospora umbrina TaxID=111806 RepID=A0A3D9SXU4_9ACTN|nr:ABC transporter permease [Thermomonospora umbrina]REF00783.1 monosaccharide ABC transporter membrane protein (CUT2 family) [Thermomonospora umbrina]
MAIQHMPAPRRTAREPRADGRRRLQRALLRPEFTAVASTVVVFVIFAIAGGDDGFLSSPGIRNVFQVSATIGIVAAPMTLLMVCGEFDLSVGAMVGAAEIMFAYPVIHGWPLWAALLLTLAGAAVVGLVNGILVIRTSIPSFLVSLAMMFIVAGAAAAVANGSLGGTTIAGVTDALQGDPLLRLFSGNIGDWIPVAAVWWIAISLLAAWVLIGTRFGNWISVTGGARESAQRAGIPVARVKVLMFVITSAGAALAGVLAALYANTASVSDGSSLQFEVIVAAVIGGTFVFGGIGTPIGTVFGALFFGLVYQGFYFTDIDTNWFLALLGTLLLVAVMSNNTARRLTMRRLRDDR